MFVIFVTLFLLPAALQLDFAWELTTQVRARVAGWQAAKKGAQQCQKVAQLKAILAGEMMINHGVLG